MVVRPPATPVFRVAHGPDPFAPRDWQDAHEDGTFGNRFDDPGGRPDPTGQRGSIPLDARFRVISCANQRAGAFAETIARFRPDPGRYLALQQIADDEPLDPSLRGGVVPVDWRIQRWLGVTRLDAALRFVDIVAPESRAHLTAALAPLLLPEGDETLQRAMAGYKQTRGSIQFPLNQPMPYELMSDIVRCLIQEKAAL